MSDQIFPESELPIRRTLDLLPQVFKTEANEKFFGGVVDPLVQPGSLKKLVGYIGQRFGKTYKGDDIYLDSDATLRSRYQLEPGVVLKEKNKNTSFYDYIDFKNQLKFFNNNLDKDHLITSQEHYSWSPPIDWDKFINFREYYWIPSGPPVVKVLGQIGKITSTYRVKSGPNLTWIFYPDGQTNNPTITLYRGQTYNFQINSPGEAFSIRSAFDTGSLIFNPLKSYVPKQLAVYDGKLWRAKNVIPARVDATIVEGEDWELVDDVSVKTNFDYNTGVTNNGISNGTITFEVPLDSPDVLFYQSTINPDRFGRFIIVDIEANSFIDVEKEIIGKVNYTSSNDVEFTNGLLVRFAGQVKPEKYSKDYWLVENVGREIRLLKFSDLIPPEIVSDIPDVLFDNAGFDEEPFDDATNYPGKKDYVSICRASDDSNPWSRYNRWFHRSVLEYAHRINGTEFDAPDTARAKRPIIEFLPNLQLFNHGSFFTAPVDFIDNFTKDIFSIIEGSKGYNVDGEELFNGARILFTADADSLANNKIYRVEFITHNNVRQIALRETEDSNPQVGQGVLVKRGNQNKGLMYHFDGKNWKKSQEKVKINQPPLFDLYDENGISFSDTETYPVSGFVGSKILGYKIGSGISDSELGFPISYLNIDNVGDILFDNELDTLGFSYTIDQTNYTKNYNTGFYKFNDDRSFENSWVKTDKYFLQPILDSLVISEKTNIVTFKSVDWETVNFSNPSTKLLFFKNGYSYTVAYRREGNNFIFERDFEKNDTVSIELFSQAEPLEGYYRIPLGLEKNPLNQNLKEFTLGQATDHISTSLKVYEDFKGSFPGISNLRDIDSYQNRATRFLKHSGILPMAVSLLCDKEINIIKSIQYASKEYSDFKNEFIKNCFLVEYNDNIADFVDSVINFMGEPKNSTYPFSDSDMIGAGAFTKINYEVEDEEITVFALSEKFNLNEISRRAVYVYHNGNQLVYGADYEFNDTFGFVNILKTLAEGDIIEIREYLSTASNYIPPTPTKLGLYKKYLPYKYLDDRYVIPKEVIQGHDGSITASYGDYRDDALLELELRIYNNIKTNYNESLFDADQVLGGYYNQGDYSKEDLDNIISLDFLKWISNSDIDYTDNAPFFDSQDPFTYTYSSMTDRAGTTNLPGYWRGVYKWFYDTDRPHQCPWEMLGFSEKPTWWESEYGAAPYTRNNLLLWEDLRDGVIRQGARAGRYDRYKRPTLLDHIPVDGDGKLLSPLDSGLAENFTLINNKGPFKFGDISPVEYAWRSSSDYPFAIASALCIMKPFEFITDYFDRSLLELNSLGQTVSKKTKTFLTLNDYQIPEITGYQASGLITYVASYVISKNRNPVELLSRLNNLDVKLSTRISGFVDQTEQKYLLDSKSPRSSTSNIFIPPENYDIIFNISSPILSVSYSAVIVEKLNNGWKIKGYDNQRPYFNYFEPVKSTADPLVVIGGTSERFTEWQANKVYSNGVLVKYAETYYRALRSHTSGDTFDISVWKKLAALPLVGGQQANFRLTFDNSKVKTLSYGSVLRTVQDVVDFLLGYENYLISQGFRFDKYDPENQVAYNWSTSCREFLFWTKHRWEEGSLITLSPGAQELTLTFPLGVVDNLFDPFYEYQIYKSDGTPLLPIFVNVKRDFQKTVISSVNNTDGIYFIRFNFVLKEHVTIFDDRTVFNDVIYDKTTGYRQERIKSRGFRTTDWDGDYTSPGFLFDNVNIQDWQPFVDYRLGDIVSYQSFYYTSLVNQFGSDEFDDNKWSKLDVTPTKGLVANFDYRINQFEDYYDMDADGLGSSQRDLSRHVLGYQTREYLQNLAEDQVSQFKLYQGFIREKGSSNSITKIFEKLTTSSEEGVALNEEWAFRIGKFGGYDQYSETEFRLHKNNFKLNPQPILIGENNERSEVLDQYMRIPQKDFTISSIPFTVDINPTKKYQLGARTAGYVNSLHVKTSVKTRDDILNLEILDFNENDHIWVTFDKTSWTVLRYTRSKILVVTNITTAEVGNKKVIKLFINRKHGLNVGDIFGIRDVTNLQGFFKITAVEPRTISLEIPKAADSPIFNENRLINLELLVESRFFNYQESDLNAIATLSSGARLWIDKNESSEWEVVEKQLQYKSIGIRVYGVSDPSYTGISSIYVPALQRVVAGIPKSNMLVAYIDRSGGLEPIQLMPPPKDLLNPNTNLGPGKNVYGEFLCASPDGRWLAVGSPKASNVKSDYRGEFNPTASYIFGDIVLHNGNLWRAKKDVTADESTNLYPGSENWEPANIITSREDGYTGYENQGAITIYELSNQQWVERYTFISPRPAENEFYGSKATIGVSGKDYFMAVSAPGSLQNNGRVYLYKYSPIEEFREEIITYDVTVGRSSTSAFYSYFIDGTEKPILRLLVGNVYVFDQTHYTNVFGPDNNPNGNLTAPQPLDFSSDSQNGILDGGTVYDLNVTYFIDNSPVSRTEYLSKFILAATRRVEIRVVEQTANFLYYYSSNNLNLGGRIEKKYPSIAREWSHLDNHNYRGIFDSDKDYIKGSVVWHNGSLWEALEDYDGDGSSIDTGTSGWTKLSETATKSSLPISVELEDDGSTLDSGFVTDIISAGNFVPGESYIIKDLGSTDFRTIGASANEVGLIFIATGAGTGTGTAWVKIDHLAELVKRGDRFGSSLAMNMDGSILVVGAPESDGKFFPNFKGIWNKDETYFEGDVVKVIRPTSDNDSVGFYYRLDDTQLRPDDYDSTILVSSQNEEPGVSGMWTLLDDDSSILSSGKIYIYRKAIGDFYKLIQTVNAESLSLISDLNTDEIIGIGDQFGFSIDVDNSGNTIVVSSPRADINLQNQGSVYVLRYNSFKKEYRLAQKLESFETYNNELFGYSVSISERGEKIVVGAKNSPFKQIESFDENTTTFDKRRTRFYTDKGYTGQVYVFELKDKTYILSEKLETDFENNESFGHSVDCWGSAIVVSSPNYRKITNDSEQIVGQVRLFTKDTSKTSWNIIEKEKPLVDISLLKSISLFDDVKNVKISDIDIVDHNKLKILGIAEREIRFKTPYDPATYTNSTTSEVVNDSDQAWFEKNVGYLWWNLSTVKWVHYEQGDLSYKIGNWNRLAEGATVDVYEWVESNYSPSEWDKIADTVEGLALGISGKSLYGNSAYSVKRFVNPNTGIQSSQRYYFWVKSKNTIPQNRSDRRISGAEVENLIRNPEVSGIPFLAIIQADKYISYNFENFITSDTALLNFEYYKNNRMPNSVHTEYQLLTEGLADSIPAESLEQKWLDSLIGYNQAGVPVPNPSLPPKQKYGTAFRPIQTMFVDRKKALKIVIDRVNSILETRPFTDLINFGTLNSFDPIPDQRLGLYDLSVDTLIDLAEVGTVRVKRALLSANIIDGSIDTVDIIDPGFGYRIPPTVEIFGDGVNAKIELTIDNQGRINSATVIQRGRKYTRADISVRYFSVLVVTDSNVANGWSIYSWDDIRKTYFKNKTQSYDVRRYWNYSDWYEKEINPATRIAAEINNLYLEPTISVKVGDIIRIKEYANGGWALLQRVNSGSGNILENYNLVGRQGGTIKFLSDLYDVKVYDTETDAYDEQVYDKQPTRELRFIFNSIKTDIFVEDLSVEWNKLFFASMRYLFSEQLYVDWAFKTSFLKAVHNVGSLAQKPSYKNDNLESYQKYLEEVKPFRTTIREYISRYNKEDLYQSSVTDFDNPPIYSKEQGDIISVETTSEVSDSYPWKWWKDFNYYSITAIEIINSGSGYLTPPKVIIEGTGQGAEAQAYIANGSVRAIKVINPGVGYIKSPSVTLIGGNGTSEDVAKAIAIIGNSNIRTFNFDVKFDRITKTGQYVSLTQKDTFVADGVTAIFDLSYTPTRERSKIKVYKNNIPLLKSEYEITFYKSNIDMYSMTRGKLKLESLPASGDNILIEYDKNIEILDSVNRIDRYYSPTSGMLGKEVNQLMTGIDYGGVQIQGTTFDVSGGWDALPWFTDNWDSVESSSDFYYAVTSESYVGTILEKTYDVDLEFIEIKNASWPYKVYKNNQLITLGIDYTFDFAKNQINLVATKFAPGDNIRIDKLYEVGAIVEYQNKLYIATEEISNQTPIINLTPWELLRIELPYVPEDGQMITIYYRPAWNYRPGSIDSAGRFRPDPVYYNFIYDGTNNVITIRNNISISDIKVYINNELVDNTDSSIASFIESNTRLTVNPSMIEIGDTIELEVEKDNSFPTTVDPGTTEPRTIRVDDPYYNSQDSTLITNPNSLMPSFIGDNSSRSIDIQSYLEIKNGDVLIFRTLNSDGTVVIDDPNILDTKVSGGSFSSVYGTMADDIDIDGGKFIMPENVPAPEENVPGQLLDSVSIQVYHTMNTGAAPIQFSVYTGNGVKTNFDIGLNVFESRSLMVYVDKVKYDLESNDSTTLYEIDFLNNQVVFKNAPILGSVVEIISIGLGGVRLIDYQEFVADGETSLFLTRANYEITKSVLVTVNGEKVEARYINSSELLDVKNRTLIQLPVKPNLLDTVKIICLGDKAEEISQENLIRVNQQSFLFDGSTRTYLLDTFVNLTRGSKSSSALLEINGQEIKNLDSIIEIYEGSNNIFVIGKDPEQEFGAAVSENIRVYINNILRTFIIDYVYDGTTNTITISPLVLNIGDEIKIEVDNISLYRIENNQLILSNNLILAENDEIKVTWFSEYPSFDIVSDEYTGGKIKYYLSRTPLASDYLWVFRNGIRLAKDIDYEVSVPSRTVTLKEVGELSDQVKIVQFGADIRKPPMAFEIYKDMLNIYHYKRFSRNKKSVLSQPLKYYDKEIYVNDASELFEPIPNRNIPGSIFINGERIDYFAKNGNILSQLRRGSLGTAIAEEHKSGSELVDVSIKENLPYAEAQDKENFVSDGSSLIVGPLNFVPAKSKRNITNWARNTIPEEYYPCDDIEVFVGGRRLRKDSITVYDEKLGISSPSADKILEAEFSVSGNDPYIRLTEKVEAGTRITIIRRTGKVWYDKGNESASAGRTLDENESPIFKFVTQRYTELPE